LPPNLLQNLHQNEHYRALMSDMSRSSPELRRAVTNRGRRHRIRIREESSKARVIVVTTFEGDDAIQRALTPALALYPERAYTESVIAVYEFNRVELIRDVFVWAYERSCQRYVTVRDSLPEPDPFRLKYRTALRDVVGSIIKDGKKPTLGVIRKQARLLTPANDLLRFGEVALQDLQGLHEGNIARYGLRPSEFRAWLSNQTGGTVAKM
jgi:hypothetical protein